MAIGLMALALLTPPKHVHRPKVHRRAAASHDAISAKRATQIQRALVRAGYMTQISGHWDEATIAALKKFQQAHHWQTHFIPDARALLALGLVSTATPEQIARNNGS